MDELEFLEQAEKKQENILAVFMRNIKIVAKAFLDAILDSLDELDMTPESRMKDWQTVTRYRLFFRTMLSTAGYDVAVDGLLQEMKKVTVQIESYYEPYGFSKYSSFFHQAGSDALERVKAQLVEVIPETAFIQPVSQAVENAVLSGQTVADLRKQMRQIVYTEDLPANYVFNQARQGLWMFHRNYSNSIGNALDLTHYYFDGVAVEHSRAWCLKRKGKAFKKEEIESWVNEDWQGKIPGTTKESIFWLLGGYNCIDVLRPITEQLYNRLKSNN